MHKLAPDSKASAATKTCKNCQAEMPAETTKCPNCGHHVP
jgi:RNA polymerase subunit RPABC4/transcription elongation factor Spt4